MKTVFDYKKDLDTLHFTEQEKAAMADRLLRSAQAHTPPRRRRHPLGRGMAVAAAAALCLCVVAGAAGVLKAPSQVFAPVFGTAETEIIDKIGHPVDASATADGVTVTADAVIGDKYHYAIVYTIAKDDGTAFDADLTPIPESGVLNLRWQSSNTTVGLPVGGHGSSYFFDADPADNAIQYIEQYSPNKPLSPGGRVKTVFQDLCPGAPGSEPLAEGKWVLRFAMNFEDASVALSAGQETSLNGMDVTVDAVTLSPLALRVDYTVHEEFVWAEQEDGRISEENAALQDAFLDDLTLRVTMKDGTVYDLTGSAGGQIDRSQKGVTVCSKDNLLPQVVDLADVASVTVGDCVIPVEL
ncbi:MAG TPA: DUF4179 domain-containing protein [Firmicutes bacterium]|nr:DUF4179 domain-containing protein [Bacillota bacterium]